MNICVSKCDKCDGPHESLACPHYPHPKGFDPFSRAVARVVCKTGCQHHTSYFIEGLGWGCCESKDLNHPGCVFGETTRHHPTRFEYWNNGDGNYGYDFDCCDKRFRDEPGCQPGLHPLNK